VAALRAVKAATGLCFHRIRNVTRDNFDAYLRRERSKGRPVECTNGRQRPRSHTKPHQWGWRAPRSGGRAAPFTGLCV